MEISELTFRLLLIFIPGFLFLYSIRKFTKDKEFNAFEVFTYALIAGLFCYSLLGGIYTLTGKGSLSVWSIFTFSEAEITIDKFEILFASIISIGLAMLYVLTHRKKWLYKLLLHMGITDKYGDDSTYYTFLNQEDVDQIYIYDFELNLIHQGQILSFSENNDTLEVLLIGCDTYDNVTMNKVLENKETYLTFKKSNRILILKA